MSSICGMGMILDYRLTLSNHLEKSSKKLNQVIAKIRNLQCIFTYIAKYNSLVFLHLD